MTAKTPLTLIGLGPMGQAMVTRFLDAGHPTTVWNRTPARADAVVALGATRAATAAEAVAANRLLVLSLTDYAAMYDILDGHDLAGRVVVNLSSETPDQTLKAAAWLAERGAELLVGGVMANAEMVGHPAAYVFYSGPREVFDRHADTLAVIGRPDYLGEDHTLAQLLYQAQLDVFLTSLAAMLHGIALVTSAGLTAERYAPYLTDNLNTLSMYVAETAKHVDADEHPGDLANAAMMGATAAHIVGASESVGVDSELPRAVQSLYDRAIAAGHGKDSWTALINVLRS
ncbi:3-hydroxyisobutyrate dehydrogenase-like beta-hydroxyacid dehydrogenase [Saccharothrix carnea]|uniref:3-hydroxyisobutyrate dehydrogenase-like beta-hydroxyacid dehydrogenase n=1 Tax=Saccharothrix carnea TaxID=1280637 RepID=A0A2P8I8D1_SACCR|nr:NAD(P)-binding domain-containing protein [Saccharothrix carnea]PSL54724.1 3-hydroxyisobutyrate dehydrogenase-like beta-hydroxyacid dehydrogenase [Saccharothrix carnea]